MFLYNYGFLTKYSAKMTGSLEISKDSAYDHEGCSSRILLLCIMRLSLLQKSIFL